MCIIPKREKNYLNREKCTLESVNILPTTYSMA